MDRLALDSPCYSQLARHNDFKTCFISQSGARNRCSAAFDRQNQGKCSYFKSKHSSQINQNLIVQIMTFDLINMTAFAVILQITWYDRLLVNIFVLNTEDLWILFYV